MNKIKILKFAKISIDRKQKFMDNAHNSIFCKDYERDGNI